MRISEIYLSVQGEGPRVGLPTVFVRFAGCNLRCPGWPCDTPHAIDPAQYRHEWREYSPSRVADEVLELMKGLSRCNVCFTGGEPFLQRAAEMDELINTLLHEPEPQKGVVLEAFSNGTIPFTSLAADCVCFVMDWKLPGSGEGFSKSGLVRRQNYLKLGYKDAVKFTIADQGDYERAKGIYNLAIIDNDKPTFYYGVVWGKLTDAELVGWVLEDGLPWRHNMQVHNIVWPRDQRGT